MPLILVSVANGIGTVTLNCPEKRNAVSTDSIDDLTRALEAMASDPDVRVVVLRAAEGEKVRSAGHDVHELPQSGGRDPLSYTE